MKEFARRRAALAETMRAHGGGVAVVFTAPEVARNRDSDFPYRYDSYFHYLTGFGEPESVVVVIAREGATRSILFCRSKHEEREIWDGFRYGPKAARKRFGFDDAYPIEELDAQMPKLLAGDGAPPELHAQGRFVDDRQVRCRVVPVDHGLALDAEGDPVLDIRR